MTGPCPWPGWWLIIGPCQIFPTPIGLGKTGFGPIAYSHLDRCSSSAGLPDWREQGYLCVRLRHDCSPFGIGSVVPRIETEVSRPDPLPSGSRHATHLVGCR